MNRIAYYLLSVALLAAGVATAAATSSNNYKQTNLAANAANVANNIDPQLSNSWGVAFLPGAPFWIADNNSGFSTLYDHNGVKQQLVVGIPSAANNPCNPGCPTGIVANGSADFGG